MGKRKKSSRGPVKKLKQKLDTQFTCLFCNHEKAINCTIDKKTNIGTLTCKICGQSFQTSINSLSEPIDIYSTWIDACEAVAEEEEKKNTNLGIDDEFGDEEYNEDVKNDEIKEKLRRKVEDSDDDDF